MSKKSKIEEYIQRVCKQVQDADMRRSIKKEMEEHLAESVEYLMRTHDLSREEAEEQAVLQMGSDDTMAKGLNEVEFSFANRIKRVSAIIALVSGVGLILDYVLKLFRNNPDAVGISREGGEITAIYISTTFLTSLLIGIFAASFITAIVLVVVHVAQKQ